MLWPTQPVGIDDPGIIAKFLKCLMDFVELSNDPDPVEFNRILTLVDDFRRQEHEYIVSRKVDSVVVAVR